MNKPVVSFSRFVIALFAVSALTVSAFADIVSVPFVKVDVNGYNNSTDKNTSGSLPGYNAANFANATLTNTLNISPESGISVTTTRITTKTNRDRTNSNCDALTNDFIFENATGNTVSSTITGLVVGKEYSLTVYSHDTGSGASSASSWTLAQGEGAAVNIGTVTNSQTAHKTTDANTHLTYTFTAEANTVVLTGSIANGLVVLNGLEMTESFDAASGYTYFDVNSNQKDGTLSRIISPRATEFFVDNTNTSNTATATAPSGITMTVTSDSVLNSRTRNVTNASADMNLYSDFLFSGAKKPFTVTLDNLSEDTIYRMTVHSIDAGNNQSAGAWTLTNDNGDVLFTNNHTPTFNSPSTWSFSKTFKPGTTSVSMLAELNGKAYTMFNGLELQEITAATSDYTWVPGRAQWSAANKWQKQDGTTGTPAAGDICYVTSPDATGTNQNYWLETTTTAFNGTLVMGSGSRLIFKTDATANDMILDGAYLHHGEGNKTFTLSGNMTVVGDSTIDIDDGDKRTLKIASVIAGPGNLTINGNGANNAMVEITRGYAGYTGNFILNKVNLKLSTDQGCAGAGDLDIPANSKVTLDGTNYPLHYINSLTGSGPIEIVGVSRFDLASSEPQAYSGTISIAADKQMHIGYTISGDRASDVNLPNATISLASGANLGLMHYNNSEVASNLVIGTLNGVAGTMVRSSGYVANGSKFATITVGQGDFAGIIGGETTYHVKMALIKNTDGTLTLSGNNVYAGGTTIEAGKIVLTGSGTLGVGKTTIGENGTLEYNVADNAVKQVDITTATAISGSGTIIKSGSGILKINNENYAGSFVADSFTVNAGELDFKGYFEGDIEIINGAVLSPGNSTGTLNVTGNVVVDSGIALFEFDSFDEGTFDVLNIVNGTTENAFTAGNGTIELSFLNDDADAWAASGDAYKLVSDEGFQIGDFTSWLTDDFGGLFGLEGRADGLYLVAAASPEPGSGVPEPSTWALLALGAAGLLYWRKRK